MDISDIIKRIRSKKLMTQCEFADYLGVSFSTVNRWENRRADPNFQALKKIKKCCEKEGIHFEYDINEVKNNEFN